MVFHAVSDDSIVFTDDYSLDEINREIHIKNIVDDFRSNFSHPCWVNIFDDKDNLVKRVFVL